MANLLATEMVWDARADRVRFQGKVYPRGVQYRDVRYLYAEAKEWAIFQAPLWTGKNYALWVKALESQAGKPYDKVGIKDFVTGMITGRYSDYNYAPSNPDESKAWFCDEYAVFAACAASILPPLQLPPFTLTPGAALNLFIGAGWSMIANRGDV